MRELVLFLIFVACASAQRSSEWNFLSSDSMFQDPHGMLNAYLSAKADALLEQRQHTIEGITTRGDLAKRQQYWREKMWSDLGGQPERTPLNPRTVGVLDRGDYRIEKIIFESRPHFYVTANLYIPARRHIPRSFIRSATKKAQRRTRPGSTLSRVWPAAALFA
jgi:hypothetical protein